MISPNPESSEPLKKYYYVRQGLSEGQIFTLNLFRSWFLLWKTLGTGPSPLVPAVETGLSEILIRAKTVI